MRTIARHYSPSEWTFQVGASANLMEQLRDVKMTLSDVADRIFQGLVTGADPVFLLEHRGGRYFSEATGKEHELEPELLHPLCKGSVNIRRYLVDDVTKAILFPYTLVDGKATLIPATEFATTYPKAWSYLKECRGILEAREHGKWKHDKWYAFGRSQNLSEMEQKKILTPSIAASAAFTLDQNEQYYFVGSGGGGGGGYGITLKPDLNVEYEYVLGLLNSELLDAVLKSISSRFSGGYFAYNRQYIEKLPIKLPDGTQTGKKAHDNIVNLVRQILQTRAQIAERNAHDRTLLERKAAALEAHLDGAVYELYGIDEAGIATARSLAKH